MTKSPLGKSATDHDICLCECELINVLIELTISEVETDEKLCLFTCGEASRSMDDDSSPRFIWLTEAFRVQESLAT